MIENLHALLFDIHPALDDTETWDSLIVNRREPFTYRVFRQFGDYRVCLHRFAPCGPQDCFEHPHPWAGAFLMLKGEYIHKVGVAHNLQDSPIVMPFRELVRPYSMYEITDPLVWHSVQPTMESYTIMCNTEPWSVQHKETRTTKGKDLDKFSPDELRRHLKAFKYLLQTYLDYLKIVDTISTTESHFASQKTGK
jgi:hypothetical protein